VRVKLKRIPQRILSNRIAINLVFPLVTWFKGDRYEK
jgi:hypothetical protein